MFNAKCRVEAGEVGPYKGKSMDHLLFHCPKLSAQREVIQQQIGTWPVRKEDLVSKYQKEFSDFVNSIDFDVIQKTG